MGRPASGVRWARWNRGPLMVGVGLLLVLAAPLLWVFLGRPPEVRPVGPGTAQRLAGPVTPAATPSAASTAGPAAPQPARTTPTPARLAIPALRLDARVIPVGVAADGQLAVPDDVRTIGWYRFGVAPGAATGSVVLIGHVDSATEGLGAFFELRTLGRGAEVTVTTSDQRRHRYRVVSRELFPKQDVPLRQIFAKSGPARLTLVTCGGPFDAATRSYRDNVVVTALPV